MTTSNATVSNETLSNEKLYNKVVKLSDNFGTLKDDITSQLSKLIKTSTREGNQEELNVWLDAWKDSEIRRLAKKAGESITLEQAAHIRTNMQGPNAQGTKKPSRTETQDLWVQGAQRSWLRLLGDATKLADPDKAQKANTSKTPKAEIVQAPVTPIALTSEDAFNHIQLQAKTLYMYSQKNARVLSLEMKELINAFHKSVTMVELETSKASPSQEAA